MTAFPFYLHGPSVEDTPVANIAVTPLRTGTEVPNGGAYAFASRAVGAGGVETFRIASTGDDDLVVSAASADGDFALSVDPTGETVPPGGHFDFAVEVDTATAGAKSGTLHISSNAAGGSAEFEISLSASVYDLLGSDSAGPCPVRGVAGGAPSTGRGPLSMD